jgi:four helix bundle protein
MQDFRNLKVWEKGHALTLSVYAATRSFPREELFGLASQMRRSASSVPSNLAEGCGRDTKAAMAYFAGISMGSASELEYQLLLSRDLGLLVESDYASMNSQTVEVKRMLASYIRSQRPNRSRRSRGHEDLTPESLTPEIL